MTNRHTIAALSRRLYIRVLAASALALLLIDSGSMRPSVQAQSGPNSISIENALAGATDWDVTGSGDPTIQGFATDISVNTGETVHFKIASGGPYRIDVYRLGYYGGSGARKLATI